MTTLALSDILDVLAKETADLAGLAGRLDRMLPAAVSCLPEGRRAEFNDLQRIDALFQHLDDMTRVVRTLSASVDRDVQVSERSLVENVRLEHFKTLFHGARPDSIDHHPPGQVHLF